MEVTFTAPIWEWSARASWYFVSLPDGQADDIEQRFGGTAGGFGSLRVEATIGATTWRTSIFPSSEHRTYVLPLKKSVRTAEGLVPDGTATVALRILVDGSAR